MGGQQAKQLFSPSGKQRVGSNREFAIAIIDIAAPRLNKTTKAFNGARKGARPPQPVLRSSCYGGWIACYGGWTKYAKSKHPGPEDQVLVIPSGDLLCWSFIDLLKIQKSNHKFQINSKSQYQNAPYQLNIFGNPNLCGHF
jgi:hypothetical protein